MLQDIGAILHDNMAWTVDLRGELIKNRLELMETALQDADRDAIYRHLFELSQLTETICKELRGAMTEFYNHLQLVGMFPALLPYPQADGISISVKGNYLVLELPSILPFSAGGSVYYLHEQVRSTLEQLIRERRLPRPFFNERCAVVFLHHYAAREGVIRHLRDYDNLEHRCITNVLASLLMCGDGPDCMISLDILAPGDRDFTEIRIMPLPEFHRFAASENFDYPAG